TGHYARIHRHNDLFTTALDIDLTPARSEATGRSQINVKSSGKQVIMPGYTGIMTCLPLLLTLI
ncbi:hypothetical protein PSZ80_24365, partial [Shigella sonnei]|nr:hypothetical protein [Shigella sonnei]